ncbi:hypothetical protein AKJ38_03505 [candidate division MSBL1 archaeon SCGC-AAA259I14]|uniref:Uncharacterized protein n=1 Tax=candidate division MSBL1 archaeon SCGC-AAA259I14 TaxID=1698268 RepID=A0A133UQ28_9EURY|nr:hypothetical protein AKJ38_03505 [candidate division MSBL1 archaeon SCGC-AAA259I14]
MKIGKSKVVYTPPSTGGCPVCRRSFFCPAAHGVPSPLPFPGSLRVASHPPALTLAVTDCKETGRRESGFRRENVREKRDRGVNRALDRGGIEG